MRSSSFSTCRPLAIAVTLALLAPTASLIAPRDAYAQASKKSVRDQLPPEAQKQWDTALDFYKRGNWDAARTSFSAAYDLSKNPRVLFNMAVCEKNLGRYARAIEIYKRELSEGKGLLAPDEEKEVQAQIDGLGAFIASLTIDVNEPGADVFVDDVKVGTSPLPGPVSVQLGERRVRATKAGFADATDAIELKPGAAGKVSLKLAANVKTGTVNVEVSGATNADVLIDGRVVGPAPYRGKIIVSAEPHEISARAPGFVGAPQHTYVKEGETVNVSLALSPEQDMGRLTVNAHPEGAIIEIDGKVVGATKWEGPVEARTHEIVVKKSGYYPWNYDVEVPKGGERTVSTTLNEDRNTSFVPWLIGTILVVGVGTTALVFMLQPKDQSPVNGTLAPYSVGTTAFRFH